MWDIYSIGDGEFLAGILNAVAMVTGTGDFATLVRIGFGLGVLLIAVQGVLSGGRGMQWQEAMVGLVVYMIMFGPQVRVNVEDMYSGQVYPVDNVPFGVAAAGSVLSRAGYSVTTLFETGFSTPAMTEQSYGMSLKRLQAAREAMLNRINTGEANSPVAGSDVEKSWSNYVRECTLTAIDLHEQNPSVGMSLDDVLNSPLPEALHFANDDFYYTKIYIGGAPQTLSCDRAFIALDNFTKTTFLPAAKENIKAFMAPDSFLTTDQLLQNAMDGIEQYGVDIDTYLKSVYLTPIYGDAAVQHYLSSKQDVMAAIVNEAVQRRNAQWQAQKSVFETSVQPFMTFMEALFYALTPVMGLVIGLGVMGMKMIGKYLVLALWIQMWMPVMAIVNHYMHAATAGKISSVLAAVVTEPMSITGMAQWDGIIQNQLAVGGMLASSVPIIALFIVSGSYYALTNVAGQMTGQDHIDESKAAPSTPAPVQFGSMQQWDAERGLHGSDAQSAMTSFSWSAQDAQQTASSQEAMHAATSNFSSMLGQRVSAMSGTSQKGGESYSFGRGTRVGNSASESMLRQKAESLSDKWSHTQGLSTETLAAFGAQAAAGGSQAALKTNIQQNTKLSETEATALADDLTSKFSEDESWNAQYSQQVAKEFSQGSENIYTRGTGLSEDKQLQEAAQESYSATEKYNEAVTSGVTVGTRQDVDGVKAGKNLAANSDANARLESAITSTGLKGAVDQWMDSPSGEDTVRQMGGDRDAAESYAMLLTANGQNQYADTSRLSSSAQGILQDTANSALAQTFGQIGGPAFGDRASSNADIADDHVPQQGSVEGQVSSAVEDMRVPQADQVRGNAAMGLAHAQQQSRGPSDQSLQGDYQDRTDHIRAASNPSFEAFKSEDQSRTRDEIEKQNNRAASSQFATQAGGGATETAKNMRDVLGAAKDAFTGKAGFQESLNDRAAEQYYKHFDKALSHNLPEDQAEYYARRASQAGLDDRALDSLSESGWMGEKTARALGFDVDYAKQTDAMGEKLDPQVRESLDKAAFEGGEDGLRLERVGDLSNPYETFPERQALAPNRESGVASYSPGHELNGFMPPQGGSNDESTRSSDQRPSALASGQSDRGAQETNLGAPAITTNHDTTSPNDGSTATTQANGQALDGILSETNSEQTGAIDTVTPLRADGRGQNDNANEPFVPSIDSIPNADPSQYGQGQTTASTDPMPLAATTSPATEQSDAHIAPTRFESSIEPDRKNGMSAGFEENAHPLANEVSSFASYSVTNDSTPADSGKANAPRLNESQPVLNPQTATDSNASLTPDLNAAEPDNARDGKEQDISWTMTGPLATAGGAESSENSEAGDRVNTHTSIASHSSNSTSRGSVPELATAPQPGPAGMAAATSNRGSNTQPTARSSVANSLGAIDSAAPTFRATDSS
ncbi:pilus assembly protein, partial [Salinisphaera shabanensis T35B1]